jgi:peptidoglycan/xylan/chitin deacetylase (PgdA/CDA1 family)
MSRFYTTTIFLVLIGLGAGLSLEGLMRWLVLGLLLGVYIVILVIGVSILKFNFFVKSTCRGETTTRHVALTFDDGPDPAATPKLLETLNRHGIKAAFFPIGSKVNDHPEIAKQMDQQGHILGNHTFRHAWWTNFMMGGALEREIGRAQGAVEAAIGKVPVYFRPPMGLTNPHLKRTLRTHGLSVIGWDVRGYDTRASSEKVIKRVLKKIRNGSIILLHDAGKEPALLVSQIDALIHEIKAHKYTFSGLEDITGIGPYHTRDRVPTPQSRIISRAWHESGAGGRRGRLRRFFAQVLSSSAYVKGANQERANLDVFKTRPSRRFLIGIGLVLFSYVLGWPMVGLFSFLAAYFQAPALLIFGPAFYGFSFLIWAFGVYLAGLDSIKYAHIVLRWSLRKAVEKNLNQELEGPRKDRPA